LNADRSIQGHRCQTKVCAWEFIIRQVLGNATFTGAGPSNTENINSIFEQAQSNMPVHGQHFH